MFGKVRQEPTQPNIPWHCLNRLFHENFGCKYSEVLDFLYNKEFFEHCKAAGYTKNALQNQMQMHLNCTKLDGFIERVCTCHEFQNKN
jgi:hypothetical protein